MAVNASIPKGTRDFSAKQLAGRLHIMQTIRQVFELYGFEPIETPAMENLETLTGKYGTEGDKLIFKILNSGDFLSKADERSLTDKNSNLLAPSIAEKALRYDLTIPFARYVVMHQNDITFPFRRYQMQPVWRADRPQKGRYREFFQCDADVIGTDSLLCEVELVMIYAEVFKRLDIPVAIRLNNRKILEGIAAKLGLESHFNLFTIVLDKLDKIGWDGVQSELQKAGIDVSVTQKMQTILDQNWDQLRVTLEDNPVGTQGIAEMDFVLNHLGDYKSEVQIDLSLARGLDYYTGTILEVSPKNASLGSVGGGGRYDNLTGVFGLPGVSGVGISFGLDRIYDCMEELGLLQNLANVSTKILFVNFDMDTASYVFQIMTRLRKSGIASEIYPTADKLKKQMKYADSKGIPVVVLIGSEEMKAGKATLKDMQSGEQSSIAVDELGTWLNNRIK